MSKPSSKAMKMMGEEDDGKKKSSKASKLMGNDDDEQGGDDGDEGGGVVFEGPLKKKSPRGMLKVYQDRHFRLFPHSLRYYKSQKDTSCSGSINLLTIKFVLPAEGESRFELVTGEGGSTRTFVLKAPTIPDRDKWVAVITESVKKVYATQEQKKSGPTKSSLADQVLPKEELKKLDPNAEKKIKFYE